MRETGSVTGASSGDGDAGSLIPSSVLALYASRCMPCSQRTQNLVGENGDLVPEYVRSAVRLRPIIALSALALTVPVLAGCAGLGAAEQSPSAQLSDLCGAMKESGPATDAVSVSGKVGETATLEFEKGLDVPALEAKLIAKGEGEIPESGDLVSYAITAYDAETGELLDSVGYEAGDMAPVQLSADNIVAQVLGCHPVGSRVIAAFPASESASANIFAIDLLEIVPDYATGEPQEVASSLPQVTLAENGAPSVDIPDAEAPTKTEIHTLKKGDGYMVQEGDYVVMQYAGVRWSNGEQFDATWKEGGMPYGSPTTAFVAGFQQALVGQSVGSQVLAVITPEDGYGDGEINDTDLTGETLVFVIDIIGAQAALAPE